MVVVLWIPGCKRVWLQESLTKRKPGPLVLGGSSPISYAQFGPKHPHKLETELLAHKGAGVCRTPSELQRRRQAFYLAECLAFQALRLRLTGFR